MKPAQRCSWCGTDPVYIDYHDHIWGRPVADAQILFEKLCLDGQQAGLSWITILKKQPGYAKAFAGFDPTIIATWGDKQVEKLMHDTGIVRNRLKIQSIIKNAQAYLQLAEKGIDFSHFIWDCVDGKPKINHFRTLSEVPANTAHSDLLAKQLKKSGFNFVGTTIVYAFMQAVGLVNDHLVHCPQHQECCRLADQFSL